MNNRRCTGIGGLITAIVILFILSELLPALVGLIKVLIIICGVAFVVLLFGIIVSGLKSGEKESESRRAEGEIELTKEQKDALSQASQTVSRIRIGAAKIQNTQIRELFCEVADKTDKVLRQLKKDPKDFQNGRRVLNYYCGAVEEIEKKYLKLLSAEGNAADTEEKLTENLRQVSSALDKLCRSLFEDDRLDLTVEMKALSVALKRDGLVDDLAQIAEDFK